MSSNTKKPTREEKLRTALRDNLKKRKAQMRKITGDDEEKSVSLRDRDVVAHSKQEDQS